MKKNKTFTSKRVPYSKKPENLSLRDWQIILRRQYAQDNSFGIKIIDSDSYISHFLVMNPRTNNVYRVALKAEMSDSDFCTCMDFKSNGLGTCKHIEAVHHELKENKKLNNVFKSLPKAVHSAIYLQYGEIRKIKFHLGHSDNTEILKIAKDYFDDNNELKENSVDSVKTFIHKVSRLDPSFIVYEDAMEFILDQRDSAARTQILNKKYQDNGNEEALNDLLNVSLYPYQQEGVRFIIRAGRSLVADDMGLGKTVQAIAACEWFEKERSVSSVLIICPTSLKYQWKSEIERFTDKQALVVEGGYPIRRKQYLEDDTFYKIISHHVAANDQTILSEMAPEVIILDEAQRIKNWNTKLSNQIKRLKSDYAIVLTGTPLENKIEELYSIMQFVNPFKLGPLYLFIHEHQIRDDVGKVIGYKKLTEIGKVLEDTLIRRTKKEVFDQLPERMDKNLIVPMTDQQREIHEEYGEAVARLVHKWRNTGFLSEKDRQRLLIFLNTMRMVCDSTFILDQETRHDTKIDELFSILEEVFNQGKEKVVIFSQWERMTRLVARELEIRAIGYEYLHGGVPGKKREDLLNNFKNKKDSMVFLSTDAGGVGLNLQSASIVINLDLPWNPAVLEQRIGRVHRLGQKRKVSVINMVSRDSIEYRMLNLLSFKSSLAKGILDQGEDSIIMEGGRLKKFMESVEDLTEKKPQDLSMQASRQVEEIPPDSPVLEGESGPVQGRIIFGDDDTQNNGGADQKVKGSSQTSDYAELISTGTQFIGKLAKFVNEHTQDGKPVDLFEDDPKTGKSFLKIPVENKEVFEQAFIAIAGLIKNLK